MEYKNGELCDAKMSICQNILISNRKNSEVLRHPWCICFLAAVISFKHAHKTSKTTCCNHLNRFICLIKKKMIYSVKSCIITIMKANHLPFRLGKQFSCKQHISPEFRQTYLKLCCCSGPVQFHSQKEAS